MTQPRLLTPEVKVEQLFTIDEHDMNSLCEATVEAILDGNGFGWLKPPPRHVLERYWRGVVLVPERELYVARLDGHIVGSGQLLKPAVNNEAQRHAATLTTFFIAPYARGHGLARGLLAQVAESARTQGFRQVDLDVRETQSAAIALYEQMGFKRWATKERYALVGDRYVAGHFYIKVLDDEVAA